MQHTFLWGKVSRSGVNSSLGLSFNQPLALPLIPSNVDVRGELGYFGVACSPFLFVYSLPQVCSGPVSPSRLDSTLRFVF